MKPFNQLIKKLNILNFKWLAFGLVCFAQINCNQSIAIIPSIKDFTAVREESWLVTHNGKVIHFSGGGRHITEKKFETKIIQIYFLNESLGWALDEKGQIWATGNGGKDWQKKAHLTEESPALFSSRLIFIDEKVGWLIGAFTVWTTEDGGNSWTMTHPTKQWHYETIGQPLSISAVDSNVVWLGFSKGGLLKTNDRGKNWEHITTPAKIDIDALYAFGADECFISGRGDKRGLFYTSDGGKNWKDVLPAEISKNLGIESISFTDKNIGWAAGLYFVTDLNNPATDIDILLKTTDGGKNWEKIETHIREDNGFDKINFADSNNGWLLGERTIYRSEDGGATWSKIFEINDNEQPRK